MTHDALSTLPLAFFFMAPELSAKSWPKEKLADCSNCPMVKPDKQDPGRPIFLDDAKCCTYQPTIHNFYVGRLLRDGGVGAEVMRKHFKHQARLHPLHVKPSEVMVKSFDERGPDDYGRKMELRCPYWVGGEFSCGIWANRNSICRTWHCKHVHGLHGLILWTGMGRLLQRCEELLAQACIDRKAPPKEGASTAEWEEWYIACAEMVDRMEPQELAVLGQDPEIAAFREYITKDFDRLTERMPDIVVPRVSEVHDLDDKVRLVGYSPFMGTVAPRTIFVFLSKLDGTRTWRRALKDTEEETSSVISEDVIKAMYRLGILVMYREEGPDDGPDEAVVIGAPGGD